MFFSTTFNSFCQWVDIVLTKEGIRTLTDIVIVDPMQVDLFPWSYTTQNFSVSDAIQAKERICSNWHPIDHFFLLAIEVFGCLHKHVNAFLHDYVNAIWNLGHFSLSKNYNHVTKDVTSSILRRVVVIGVTTFRLPPL